MRQQKRERHGKILAALGLASNLRVTDLARQLGVSTETIRRDFDELTHAGMLNRTYGGAVSSLGASNTTAAKQDLFHAERQRIAEATVTQVADARILLIGSGATTVRVAQQIAAQLKNITVVTHAFGVAQALANNGTIEVMMIPGLYHPEEASTTGGHAIVFLQSLYVDYVILGASGLTGDGPGSAVPEIAAVNAAMLGRAEKCIVTADRSAFNLHYATRYADWPRVSKLVTDAQPPPALLNTLRKSQVELLVV